MSLKVINIKKKENDEIQCLFCNETSNFFKNPKPQSFINVRRAADRRKDDISEKIKK